ncbi:Uncharacterised protein [uncultured archaeon]|nr:Uncharacterised protein [uncultured archaeon]
MGGVKRSLLLIIVLGIILINFCSASRLPINGSDNSTWGVVLNDYLTSLAGANATELNTTMVNGTNIYAYSINTTHIVNGSIDSDKINFVSVGISNFTNDANYLDKDEGGIISGSLVVDGNLTVTGSYINATITNQNLNGSLIPEINNLFDLGSSLFRWNTIYLTRIYTSSILADDWSNVTITKSQVSNADWLNQSQADSLYSGLQWGYNMTAPFSNWLSTFNFDYNQTTEANAYTDSIVLANNNSWLSTYNATYHTISQDVSVNRSVWESTYNATYAANTGENASWNQSLANSLYAPNTTAGIQSLLTNANLTLSKKITFAFGEVIDNIIATWIRINGNLNVTGNTTLEGNIDITGNVHINGNVSFKRPYGMFSSTQTQTIAVANTAYPVTFNWTEDSYELTKSSDNANFSFGQTGDYLIELSAIVDTSSPNKHVEMWVQKNGVNVPRSNTHVEITSSTTESLIVVPFILDMNLTDQFRVMWASDDTGTRLLNTANTSYSPGSPSIIMTVSKISEITP